MTDTIAEAAANMQQADAVPSSSETGIVDKVEERLHEFADEMMEKMEHMIHPSAEAGTAEQGKSDSSTTDMDSHTTQEMQPADTSATDTIPATADASASLSTESGSSGGTEGNAVTPVASTDAPANIGDDPNAAVASAVAEPSGSVTASSAPPASLVADTPAASASGVRERALRSISKLRSHFWTFEHSAVQHLHTELDFLEGLFK